MALRLPSLFFHGNIAVLYLRLIYLEWTSAGRREETCILFAAGGVGAGSVAGTVAGWLLSFHSVQCSSKDTGEQAGRDPDVTPLPALSSSSGPARASWVSGTRHARRDFGGVV